jgi:hypothetical protein
MLLATRVRLTIDGPEETALVGVKVALFDRDLTKADDLLGKERTDHKGEILFTYDSSVYSDPEDSPAWKTDSLPDLYVVVYDAQDQVLYSTRSEVIKDQLPKLIPVRISRELVEKHGLLSE